MAYALGVLVLALMAPACERPKSHVSSAAMAPRVTPAQSLAQDRHSLPARPNIIEGACTTPLHWHGDASECRRPNFSAGMVRLVLRETRWAFVVVENRSPIAADMPPEYDVHLWVDGSRVIPTKMRVGPPWLDTPDARRSAFLENMHARFPRLGAVDDDTAERWLRAVALASDPGLLDVCAVAAESSRNPCLSARVVREGGRRILSMHRVLSTQDSGAAAPLGVGTTTAWLDEAGAWNVTTNVEPSEEWSDSAAPVTGPRAPGTVRLDDGEAVGGDGDFSAAEVVALLRQRLSAIRACYEVHLHRDPTLAGRVTVDFTIQTTGAVSGVRPSENTTHRPEIAACVTREVSGLRWRRGPEGGSVTFSYPFEFSPRN